MTLSEKVIHLLIEEAEKARNMAYAPYSKYLVGAALVVPSGKIYTGCNVENASYGASVWAERSAILSAISNGYKRYDFDKLYIMCDNDKIGMSCFLCRMVISELFERDREVIAMNPKGDTEIHTVEELCPYPFSDKDLL